MNGGAGSSDPARRVLDLLAGKWLTAAISAAATLGIPDSLAEGAKSVDRLAGELGCDERALARLLRVLVGEELLRENANREFELLEAGHLLRRDAYGLLARYVGSPLGWDPWSLLADAVRTGESSFVKRHGIPLFEYLDRHPADATIYDEAIATFAHREAIALASAYDFSQTRTILDVGGGRGSLLIELLNHFPHLSGLLLERPAAVLEARAAFERAGIGARCEARIGDFFESIPGGADVCVLKHVVHNWDDEAAVGLLRRSRDAVGETGRVLVVEGTLVRDGRRSLTNMLDLEMLVLCGPGHERSKPELRGLFARAGLRLVESHPLTETARLFVTEPRPRNGLPHG